MTNELTYGGVKMPDVRVVQGSTMILLADWHVEGMLPDGRVLYLDVKAGFVFDGASIPRALWRVCGHPLEAPRIAAALAHDWIYASKCVSRADADLIYRTICAWVGINAFCRNVEFAALRVCGWVAWNGHGEADRNFALAHGALELEQKKENEMKKLMMAFAAGAAVAMMAGCSTPAKMRDVEVKGMYVNGYSEVLAIGAGRVTSIPGEREAMAAHYREDTAWLQPSVKTHELDLFLVGSNTVASADKIIEHICKAFAEVAPDMVKTNAEIAKAGGTAPLDVVKAGGETRKAVQLAKTAVDSAKVAASASEAKAAAAQTATQAASDAQTATTAAADCANGACAVGTCTGGNCTDGSCTVK